MLNRIPRSVFRPADRPFYHVQYRHPLTGKVVTRSTKQTRERDAEAWAEQHLASLQMERAATRPISWRELCDEYVADQFPSQRASTKQKTTTCIEAVQEILSPKDANSLTTGDIRKFKKTIRDRQVSNYTINGYLASLRKILRWGQRNAFIRELPHIEMSEVVEPTRHVPTTADYNRMVAAVPKVVGDNAAPSWRYELEGLWLSGLRLSEADILEWRSSATAKMWVEIDCEHPVLHTAASFDKRGKSRVFPMAPEFAEFLRKIPTDKRKGRVFNPEPYGNARSASRPPLDRQIKTFSAIGREAGVAVSEKTPREPLKKGVKPDLKWASAHDLRRAWCTLWASRVPAPVLLEMARHDNMTTTMKFYRGRNAEASARQAWDAYRAHGKDDERAAS
jgi:integrase